MGFDFGGIASLAGGILGGLGGGVEGGNPVPTWDMVPKPVQDAILETFLPDALDRFKQERTPTPMFRGGMTGSSIPLRGVQNLQNYSDSIGGMFTPVALQGQGQQPQQPTDQGMGGAQYNELLGRMMVQQQAGPGGMYATNRNQPYLQFQQQASGDDMAKMGELLMNAMPGTGAYAGGFQDRNTGQFIDISNLLAKHRRG